MFDITFIIYKANFVMSDENVGFDSISHTIGFFFNLEV